MTKVENLVTLAAPPYRRAETFPTLPRGEMKCAPGTSYRAASRGRTLNVPSFNAFVVSYAPLA